MLSTVAAGKVSVMVVDCDAGHARHIAGVLEGADYRVITRDFGIGTGGAILRAHPAVVLVELSMPLLDGTEIVATVRRSKMLEDTRVVLMGDRPAGELAELAKGCGANSSLTTPVDPETLLATIRRLTRVRAKSATRRSGTRHRIGGYIFVAGDDLTVRLLRGTLGARASALFSDSGTEALRLIYSTRPPRLVVVGTSLTDLPYDVIWRKAVDLDESWTERLIIAEELPDDERARALEPRMLRWSPSEDPERLLDMFERLERAV